MSEQLDVLRDVLGRLKAGGFAHMVTGSVAMNYYAQPRMTRDIDLVLDIVPADSERFLGLFAGDYYLDPPAVREAIRSRSMFNLIHLRLVHKVDCMVRKDDEHHRAEFARRRDVVVEGFSLSIVSPEDLVAAKLYWARDTRSELQLGDVRNLLDSIPDMDIEYIRRSAKALGTSALLGEVGL